jgi:hypothetical protein
MNPRGLAGLPGTVQVPAAMPMPAPSCRPEGRGFNSRHLHPMLIMPVITLWARSVVPLL